MSYKWATRQRNYYEELQESCGKLRRTETSEHPLSVGKNVSATGRQSSSSSSPTTSRKASLIMSLFDPLGSAFDGTDPLSHFSRAEQDPLSVTVHNDLSDISNDESTGLDVTKHKPGPWNPKKAAILSKFTTSEKMSIVTSFLPGGDRIVIKASSTVTEAEKIRSRLEQLDTFEEGSVREVVGLSQQEYIQRITQLSNELLSAWKQDQRVKALKIVIQSAKMLLDTTPLTFYPSKFVLITDLLDTFGALVFERIFTKAQEESNSGSSSRRSLSSLPANFTPGMVPESAKETCRNWFYKIASIRELLPRLYVEMAILKCYSFLSENEFTGALLRLNRTIRGLGDPLIAIYARCYLARIGLSLDNWSVEHVYLKEAVQDVFFTYHQIFSPRIKVQCIAHKVDMPTYWSLYVPALDWLMELRIKKFSATDLEDLLNKCAQQTDNGLLLHSLLSTFPADFVAERVDILVKLIASASDESYPTYSLWRSLGECLLKPQLLEIRYKTSLLNDVWSQVAKLRNSAHYMACVEVWLPFVAKHYGKHEVNILLGDLIAHLEPEPNIEQYYSQLQFLVVQLLSESRDPGSLLTMDKFLPFLDLFRKEVTRVEVSKSCLHEFLKKNGTIAVRNPELVNSLVALASVIHNSLSAQTVEDERRQASELMCKVVHLVDYGKDFEQLLAFYVEARAVFSNLETVLVHLVQLVNRLSMRTKELMQGVHSKKTASFIRATIAYSFITIPGLSNPFTRVSLYAITGQIALANQCWGQADSCLEAAIATVPDLRVYAEKMALKDSEGLMNATISNLMSSLLLCPDNLEQGHLHLARKLLRLTEDFPNKAVIYLQALRLLSASVQEEYICHIEGCDSNDVLHGGNTELSSLVENDCSSIVEELLNHLRHLGESQNFRDQASISLELMSAVISLADFNREPRLASLSVNLWNLAQKHGQWDVEYAKRLSAWVRSLGDQDGEGTIMDQLASRIVVPAGQS